MNNNRKSDRMNLDLGIELYDLDSGKQVGDVIEVSATGFRLASWKQFTPPQSLRLEVRSERVAPGALPEIEATLAWSNPEIDREQQRFVSGWSFGEGTNLAARALLVSLVADDVHKRVSGASQSTPNEA